MTNLFLCSFASSDLKLSVKRFIEQAKQTGFYQEIKVFSWNDLTENKKKQIETYFKYQKKRLYGYACWKPEIILSHLNDIPENSILQYSDIGCHLNKYGKKRLKEYLDIVLENNILAFKYYKPNFKIDKKLKYQIYFENEYTKSDMFDYFEIPINSSIRNTEQIWSGTMFFKNNFKTKNFLKKWLEVCNISHLIDDTKSNKKNSLNFIEHRHDQSAFSILCKLDKVVCLSASECEWAETENGRYWGHLKNYPVLAKRDKKYNFLKRFISRQLKNSKKIFK